MLELALAALASYLLGSIPTGIIAGKLARGIDLREQGSGNTGATNSFRVLGWRLGSAVALVDIAKGYAAVALASRIAPPSASSLPGGTAFIVASLAAVLGHVKPLFAGFRGGKGFGTAAGAISAAYPIVAPFCLAVFLATLGLTGYVALCAALSSLAPPFMYLLSRLAFGLPPEPEVLAFFIVAAALTILGVRRKLSLYFRGEAELFEKAMFLRPKRTKEDQDA
ncbi:MAG TPA: glycerol-3-phosphate 1-O-acyltransferase PlsY [Spirochaetia bacterium]|nr:glycerol-3-phosphate 1-O-acyltransferase PlsY [Spirochaetia bacterium]